MISTHTLTWSVTKGTVSAINSRLNFNSHAHVERDVLCFHHVDAVDDFNSHAHVERDVVPNTPRYLKLNFNSHAHVERDSVSNSAIGPSLISTHTLTWSVTSDYNKNRLLNRFQLTRSRGA